MKKILLTLIFFLMANPFSFSDQNVKESNVSGQFYTDDAKKLSAQIDDFYKKSSITPLKKDIEIIIAPHAGYFYSGSVAADSFKSVLGKKLSTIVILAPSHFFPYDGISIWNKGGFKTPLGTIKVDEKFSQELIEQHDKFYFDPKVFEREHSLEVMLPFLQKNYEGIKIVPVLMGQPSYDVVDSFALSLMKLIGDRSDVLIVVSTDLSHYHDDTVARAMDQKTIQTIKEIDPKRLWTMCHIKKLEACGFVPVTTALLYAKKKGLTDVDVLRYANSGDVSGDRNRVVGYSSIIISGGKDEKGGVETSALTEDGLAPLNMEQKRKLVEIARSTIDGYISTGNTPEFSIDDPRLEESEGAFVTIHKAGNLRGCIGHIVGQGPLYATVQEVAVSAATKDPRFSALSKEELGDIDVEVSVLSKPRRIRNVDEIELGVHGVIVSKGRFNRGVFLPQVATDTGWSKEQFLSVLCSQKAGLPADAWKDPGTIIEIFTADVFSEKDVKE